MKPTPLHDKYPRIPRRRTQRAYSALLVVAGLCGAVAISWLAAQGL